MMISRKIAVGIHIGHDRSVSVVENGILIGHLSQERVDRIKHSPSTQAPLEAFRQLLKYLNISISEINVIGVTYSFVDITKILDSVKEDIAEELELNNVTVIGLGHHLAHAYSAYYTSPFDEAVILVADGAGDIAGISQLEAETGYFADAEKIDLIWQRLQDIPCTYSERRNFFRFPYVPECDLEKQISLGRKYEQISYSLGFKWGESGKTMGLSSYDNPNLFLPDRSLSLKGVFDIRVRDIIDQIDQQKRDSSYSYRKYINYNRSKLAASAQFAIEEAAISMVNYLHNIFPHENLCLAGGVFLNCVLNHKIIERTPFKNIHIVPPSGDDGQSIGAAYYAYSQIYGRGIRTSWSNTYLGLSYSEAEIIKSLNNFRVKYKKLDDKEIIRAISLLIVEGCVGAIVRGRSEAGPRALGNRSIIASPSIQTMRDYLNISVKKRESFRPYAPIIIAEKQFEYFELKNTSPFMLLSAKVKENYRDILPAITHVDGTARVQAISKDDNKFMHDLLLEVQQITGHPVLLNTSFNKAGEPIVETPDDAISSFLTMGLDFLIIENFMITIDN